MREYIAGVIKQLLDFVKVDDLKEQEENIARILTKGRIDEMSAEGVVDFVQRMFRVNVLEEELFMITVDGELIKSGSLPVYALRKIYNTRRIASLILARIDGEMVPMRVMSKA